MNAPGIAKPNAIVTVGPVRFGNHAPLALIAGPCQLESRQHAFDMAGALKEIAARLGIGLVYKTSFDKANRTSLSGRRGAGLDAALPIFADLREELGLPSSPRWSTCCRSLPSSAGRPTCSSRPRRPAGSSTSRRGSSWRRGT
jgi:3-deoxy-D-arabino-heptulosonate 7-phosphate (DAHP) synthase